MMKHSLTLLVAAMAAATLAGCQLYFGENSNSGNWTYCGQDGYYECNDQDCYWRGPECPAGTAGGSGPGFECTDSNDCAAGCYCGNGICEEAGFCTNDSDCGNGYECNEQRASCEPTTTPQPTTCTTDYDCPSGSYCEGNVCTASCTCVTDAEAINGNYDHCNEERQTCMPGPDPDGTCTGTVTCNLGKPSCPLQQTPIIADGCYTGECVVIGSCAEKPACEMLSHESDCRADTTCGVSYTGINCRNPSDNNASCTAGSTNCVCDSYQFASCNTL